MSIRTHGSRWDLALAARWCAAWLVLFPTFWGQPIRAWTATISGTATNSLDRATAVTTDAAGDVIAAGSVQDENISDREFFVAKFSGATGHIVWRTIVRSAVPGSRHGQASAVAIAPQGDVVAVGETQGPNQSALFTVVKLSGADGMERWRWTTPGRANAVVVGAAGDVIAAGAAAGDLSAFFVVKLRGADGGELWRYEAPPDDTLARALALDTLGNPIAAGTISLPNAVTFGLIKLDGARGVERWRATLPSSLGSATAVAVDSRQDVIAVGDAMGFAAAKFAGESGAELWRHVEPEFTEAEAVAIDADDCAVVVGGVSVAGDQPVSAVKLCGPDGHEVWRNASACAGQGFSAIAVVVDAGGSPILSGGVRKPGRLLAYAATKLAGINGADVWCTPIGEASLGVGAALALRLDDGGVLVAGTTLGIGSGQGDFTVVRLDSDTGAQSWRTVIDGTATASDDRALGVAVAPDGDIVSVGEIKNHDTSRDFAVFKFAGDDGAVRWKYEANGTASDSIDRALAVAVDSSSDVIAAGLTENQVTGDDLTVIKLSGATGAARWAQVIKGDANGSDFALAVAIDAHGDAFIAGSIYSADTGSDFVVLKMSGETGAELWRYSVDGGARGIDEALSIAVDGSGDVFAAGITESSDSGLDFAVVKLSGKDGTELWRQSINGTFAASGDEAFAVAIDSTGDAIAAGLTSGIRLGGTTVTASDFTVVKFAGATGAELWRYVLDGTLTSSTDIAQAVAVDRTGQVFAAGRTENLQSFQDFTFVKLDATTGRPLWTRAVGALAGNTGDDEALALAIDGQGNPVVTGGTFGPTSLDFTVLKADGATGADLWRRDINGSQLGTLKPADEGLAVAIDPHGDVVAAGLTENEGTGSDFTVVKHRGIDGRDFQGAACLGDCNLDGSVTVDELLIGVNIALEATALDACVALDRNEDAMVSIDEITAAVTHGLSGCRD
jgi:hypothetical protein